MPPVKANASKDMGSLLLRGWAMLAENCPSCQVPLMRNPANKERLCVNCDAVHPDGAPLDSAGDDNAAPAEESAAPSTDQPAAAASAPVSKPRPQPSLHRTVNGDENDAEDGAAGSLAAASTGKAKEDAEAARERSDRSADLIAERLVKGWALTDKYCPRCSTPLVREKATRRMFCVDCDMWVMTESEAAAAQAAAAARGSTQPPQPAPAAQSGSAGGEVGMRAVGNGGVGLAGACPDDGDDEIMEEVDGPAPRRKRPSRRLQKRRAAKAAAAATAATADGAAAGGTEDAAGADRLSVPLPPPRHLPPVTSRSAGPVHTPPPPVNSSPAAPTPAAAATSSGRGATRGGAAHTSTSATSSGSALAAFEAVLLRKLGDVSQAIEQLDMTGQSCQRLSELLESSREIMERLAQLKGLSTAAGTGGSGGGKN